MSDQVGNQNVSFLMPRLICFRYEGLKGFYKGLTPNLLRVTPACCITFVVYEYLITKLLHSNNGNGDNNNGNKLVDKVDEIKATDNNKLESNDR